PPPLPPLPPPTGWDASGNAPASGSTAPLPEVGGDPPASGEELAADSAQPPATHESAPFCAVQTSSSPQPSEHTLAAPTSSAPALPPQLPPIAVLGMHSACCPRSSHCASRS